MSKLDAQRAMREARYARQAAAARTAPTRAAARPPVAPPLQPPEAASTSAPAAKAGPQGDTCGHKSMNGRACTRPAGHAEKSHRYS